MKNIEDLFAVEAKLRSAARLFAATNSGVAAMDLRRAARKYATLADGFEDEPGSPIVEVPS